MLLITALLFASVQLPNSSVHQHRDLGGVLLVDVQVDDEPNPEVLATAPVVGTGTRYLKCWFPREGHYMIVRTNATDEATAFVDVEAAVAVYSGVKWDGHGWRQARASVSAAERTAIAAALVDIRTRGG